MYLLNYSTKLVYKITLGISFPSSLLLGVMGVGEFAIVPGNFKP